MKAINNKKIILTLLALFVVVELFILVFNISFADATSIFSKLNSNQQLKATAEKIVEKCGKEDNRRICYRKEIPDLMDKISMEKAFQVTKYVQDIDTDYRYCHVLGHELSAVETAKDPSKWKEVAARCPSGVCSNGCIHGAFQERFRASALPQASIDRVADELENLCTKREGWDPTGMERATCYHALGHLTMYITDAQTEKSTKICDEVTKRDKSEGFKVLCYDGVYMQLFQPLEPEDFALVEGKVPEKDEAKEFCWQFEGPRRASCWNETWPLFRHDLKNPDFVMKRCNLIKDEHYRDRCFSAMFYVLTPLQFNFKPNEIKNFCVQLPDPRRSQCFANAASRMIEVDFGNNEKAANLCSSLTRYKDKSACFDELVQYSTYNFKPGSPEARQLCRLMPGPWEDECLEMQQKHQN